MGRLGEIFGLLVVLALAGCGPSGPAKYPVSGNVTWDGASLEEGFITFIPMEKNIGIQEGATIRNGAYQVNVVPAKYRVEIKANREGKFDEVVKMKTVEQYIPKQYNLESVLTAEITTGAKNMDFDLKKNEAK